MIIGTAGHIDHGKTSLVKALTGVDTDRLAEEKRRGMTIELGFARMLNESVASSGLEASLGTTGTSGTSGTSGISFIDVPGHEKLVRTMLAGASGIDFAMLVIAADDGLMPQTLEHLAILSLLKINQGCIVITKCDKVDGALLEQRVREAENIAINYGLCEFSAFCVSTIKGQGIEALRAHLFAAQLNHQAQIKVSSAYDGFRMGLDRAFSLEGIGTVVAGSIHKGLVRVGDELCLAHNPDHHYRVRSLQVHGEQVQEACAGQRCAIALAGLERTLTERGQMICSPRVVSTTERLDAYIEVSKSQLKPLRSGGVVHVHALTQERVASLAVLGRDSIEPGDSGLVQLILHRPIHLWNSDKLILRDASASSTVAGGTVLEVRGPKRYRQTPERLSYLQTQRTQDLLSRLQKGLPLAPFGVNIPQKLIDNGVDPKTDLKDLFAQGEQQKSEATGRAPIQTILTSAFLSLDQLWLIDREVLHTLKTKVLKVLAEHHSQFPEMLGLIQGRAKLTFGVQMTNDIWMRIVDQMLEEHLIGVKNGFLYLPEHGEVINDADQRIAQKVLPLIEEGGFDPPWVRDLATKTSISEIQMRMALVRLAALGELYQVVKDLFYHPAQVQRMAKIIQDIGAINSQQTGKSVVGAAQFRDATGLGRKRAIQILEFFDKIGFCKRVGDVHLIRTGTALFSQVLSDKRA